MNNNNKHITSTGSPSKLMGALIILLLAVFVNFTFSIQYVNLNGTNISLSEIIEEEEKKEHKNTTYKAVVNNSVIIKHVCCQLKETITVEHYSDVLTPPPEFMIRFL